MKTYNLAEIYSNLEQMLLNSQAELEKTIEAYGDACDHYSVLFGEYRVAKAQAVSKLKSDGHAVTIIQDLAQGMIASKKTALLQAEYNVKKLKMLVDAYIERVNGIKFIGRKTDVIVK